MATKVFCDACDREMVREFQTIAVYVQKAGRSVSFYAEKSGNTETGDICKYCIIDAFKKLDDRPAARAQRGELGAHPPELDDRMRVVLDRAEREKPKTPRALRIMASVVDHRGQRLEATEEAAWNDSGAARAAFDRLVIRLQVGVLNGVVPWADEKWKVTG